MNKLGKWKKRNGGDPRVISELSEKKGTKITNPERRERKTERKTMSKLRERESKIRVRE